MMKRTSWGEKGKIVTCTETLQLQQYFKGLNKGAGFEVKQGMSSSVGALVQQIYIN